MADHPGPSIIKICGLSDAAPLEAALTAGADMVGFVFVEGSPRVVSPAKAADLASLVRGRAQVTGLFADETVQGIAAIARDVPLDVVQLHGQETRAALAAVKAAVPARVIDARSIGTAGDLPDPGVVEPDYYLFDAKPPAGDRLLGGHGRPFDWDVLKAHDGEVPWLLAGGLTPENVADAIAACRDLPGFAGVDVSSGVEKARGKKDEGLIAAFVSAARAAMR